MTFTPEIGRWLGGGKSRGGLGVGKLWRQPLPECHWEVSSAEASGVQKVGCSCSCTWPKCRAWS